MGVVISQTNEKGQFVKGMTPWNKGIRLFYDAWTGKTHSEESKKKMSESAKGRTPWNKGKKGVQVAWNKGIRPNYIQGENHYNWKGGITTENHRLRNHIEIRLWREAVFTRDGFLCQMPDCNKQERYLNAHHIKKFSEYPKLRHEILNGITLCKICHNKTKGREEKFEGLFKVILERRTKKW